MESKLASTGESSMTGIVHPLYSLVVRQQPERARLCSYKEENETMDRRPVDPPPVVELRSSDVPTDRLLESTSFFIRATTVTSSPSPAPVPDHGYPSIMKPVYLPVKTPTGADATTGEVVQTPEKLRTLEGRVAALCIFAKLSVRVPGVFRLMFTLYETSEAGIVQLTQTVSEPFEVFSPKLFKGMHESTPLTRHLAAQGLKVKLRTDTSVGRQSISRRKGDASSRALKERTSASSLVSPGSTGATATASAPRTERGFTAQSEPTPDRIMRDGAPSMPRALVWSRSHNELLDDFDRSYSDSEPVPTSLRKRRFVDDGSVPSYADLASRFDWTPTPPATDLSAFSLSNKSELSRLAPGRDRPSPYAHRSETSSHSSSMSSHRNISPFLSASGSPLSGRTRASSARSDSQASSVLPTPFSLINIGPGDDGIPILPLPSMYGPTLRTPGFIPPSVSQVLGMPSALGNSSHPLPLPQSHPRSLSDHERLHRTSSGNNGTSGSAILADRHQPLVNSPLILPSIRPSRSDNHGS